MHYNPLCGSVDDWGPAHPINSSVGRGEERDARETRERREKEARRRREGGEKEARRRREGSESMRETRERCARECDRNARTKLH